ncbi:valine--tRNA ligase [Candidatus Falkowbacteria bacterium]|nr:valine--tRNA ligase [Candidatus Falkowbacteria bacterium]
MKEINENELPKAYEPTAHEDRIYKKWEDSGKFNPDNYDLDENSGTFTIMMPPPNATGVLHLGHASTLAYEDLMIRFARMQGKRTLWLPGTDHASIATQAKVEKLVLEKEGKTRHQLGREELLKRIDAFVEDSRNTIRSQVRKMGSSCDWSRERYTLDKGLSDSVLEIFVRMYNDGLIYRGDRIVNWCPRCKSTLADDEVNYKEGSAKFYTFKYSKDFPIAISTTRPETKLADVAVAVHPSDERYMQYIGKTFSVDFAGGTKLSIKVIPDYHVDKEFGTGALGVTPAHSAVDYQMAQEHALPIIKLINEDGIITENGGAFAGQTVAQARKSVVAYLKEQELLIEEKDIPQALSICYRCDTPIEPLPSLQWFVNMSKEVEFPDGKKSTLKERALSVVTDKKINFVPDRFEKSYADWMNNLHDWCISRQIWFGHQIPAWYRGDEVYVDKTAPEGDGWVQDTDTLDTWFSSGQWTFATLGWPDNVKQGAVAEKYEQRNDLERFHPTDVVETGYDILFFWVARMILMTEYALGEIPFKNVYLHGLIRDEKGVKMSKSLGNVIDPLGVIAKYGTDALRMSLIIGATPGNDLKLGENKVEGYRNLTNKIYNISRFILSTVKKVKRVTKKPKAKTVADEWILNELDKTIALTTERIETYQFSLAGEGLREFTWNTLADWYIEIAKIEGDKDEILLYVLEKVLILWHPFTPFVTEYVWELLGYEDMIMTQAWPRVIKEDIKEVEFDFVMNLISSIRTMRGENKLDPVLKLNALVISPDVKVLSKQEAIIKKLARLENLEITHEQQERPKASAMQVFAPASTVYLLLDGIIDIDKERARLAKEIESAQKLISATQARLANESFVKSAPVDIVESAKTQLGDAQEKVAKLTSQFESLA